MTDSKLTEDQALALLRKLATDDAFRKRFESKPAKALTEIGVPLQTIVDLDGKCHHRRKLAGKRTFKTAVDTLDKSIITKCMAMRPPQLKLGS